ncbi:hypothetical protein AURDEDRAFT_132183 [Auricularia subglabra TFB-10046 SS5]|uniref:Uncharacterized protein n=1 Tax=Auricularia subglabra (strain TFB-10046 / SS5) TaxID=717982 RepID=J0WJ32_AURST|nr:hypothetical protein AURDEDRAFT_132183 [Auricularia subglabra TFB-10046 SS5]
MSPVRKPAFSTANVFASVRMHQRTVLVEWTDLCNVKHYVQNVPVVGGYLKATDMPAEILDAAWGNAIEVFELVHGTFDARMWKAWDEKGAGAFVAEDPLVKIRASSWTAGAWQNTNTFTTSIQPVTGSSNLVLYGAQPHLLSMDKNMMSRLQGQQRANWEIFEFTYLDLLARDGLVPEEPRSVVLEWTDMNVKVRNGYLKSKDLPDDLVAAAAGRGIEVLGMIYGSVEGKKWRVLGDHTPAGICVGTLPVVKVRLVTVEFVMGHTARAAVAAHREAVASGTSNTDANTQN